MMSTRSGRVRQSISDSSPPRTRKGVSPVRSPARNRKSSPTVRSSRKSPSRKSPSRKPAPKYPARKSPSRVIKEAKEVKESSVPKSPTKRPTIKKPVEVRQEELSSKHDIRGTRTRRFDFSVTDFSSELSKTDTVLTEKVSAEQELDTSQSLNDIYSIRNRRTGEETDSRKSSKLKEIVENVSTQVRHSLTKSISKSISKSLGAYSDEEEYDDVLLKEKSKSQSVTRKLSTPLPSSTTLSLSDRFEFGGRIGAMALYIFIPLTVFYMLISCLKTCSYLPLKQLSLFKSISVWFNARAILVVVSNFLLQAFFLAAPVFGTKEVDEGGRKFCFNAIFSGFCTLNILFALDFYRIVEMDNLLSSYLQMATASYLIAVILALILFLKSRKVDKNDLNPYGVSGYVLYDFFIGREVQAVVMNINIKLWLARVSNITTLIFSVIIFKHGFYIQDKDIGSLSLDELKNVINKVHFKPTIIVYSLMQIVYALYFITREKKIVSTFYWHSEALGYLLTVSSALYPYYFTSISRNVAHTDQQLTVNALIAASTLFLLGFLVMLISNNIKHEFRKNPLQPSLFHLDSMPTFHGNKLLVSHLWGVLRHPNYTGDILIHVALALPGILSRQIIPAAPALLTILMLLHRCWRDHGRCRRRYGAAWQRYCRRVPSVVIPKIL